jgi:ubiquinone/menaquinone biosynthesis C-methylase UbiE
MGSEPTSGAAESSGDITSFTAIDRTAQERFYIDFLDIGNALPAIMRLKGAMLDALRLRAGSNVLELGCGTGDDARDIARLVGPHGRVLGLDYSGAMIAEARRRHDRAAPALEFAQGNANALELPNDSFDAVRVERMLMHLDGDPGGAIAEMARVTRPGGRVAIFDFDWDMFFIDHPDREMTRRVVRSFSDAMRHGWIGRELRRRLLDAGLIDVSAQPRPITFDYSFLHRLLDGHLENATATGDITASELQAWWSALQAADRQDRFSAGLLGFIVAATAT